MTINTVLKYGLRNAMIENSLVVLTMYLPAYLKKNEESMPCAALLNMRSIVAFECPSRMLKLLEPVNIQVEFQF